MKKHVSILEIARALGMSVRRGKAQCWRTENHSHGDANPSLSFHTKRNRCLCFVCDTKGGHSNLDLVMGVLACDFGSAVLWIAERFPVPNVKVGRPAGNTLVSPPPYRCGVHGSEWKVIIRSSLWGVLTPAERSILPVLDYFKDSDSGLTRISYRAISRYSGVKKLANISSALKELQKMHALQVSRGQRIGITRECSVYRVTLDDPKFLEICNTVYASSRKEIAQEKEYRADQKRKREQDFRKPRACSTGAPVETVSNSTPLNPEAEAQSCKGLDLSSPGEVHANLSLTSGNREIDDSEQTASARLSRNNGPPSPGTASMLGRPRNDD